MNIINAENKIADCLKIRYAVFVSEQGVPPDLEKDGYDEPGALCEHFLIEDGGAFVGTFRVLLDEHDAAHIGRLCIIPECRGRGLGRAALEFAAREYGRRGYKKLVLGAQCHAIPFYEKCGFSVVSDLYYDAGIPHRNMEKILDAGERS